MLDYELTFKISHVAADIRVEGIHNHLPIRRPRNLDPAIDQAGRRPGAAPMGVIPDGLRLGQKVGPLAGIPALLAELALVEELPARGLKGPVQDGEELEGVWGEDLAGLVVDLAEQRDLLGTVGGEDHCEYTLIRLCSFS